MRIRNHDRAFLAYPVVYNILYLKVYDWHTSKYDPLSVGKSSTDVQTDSRHQTKSE